MTVGKASGEPPSQRINTSRPEVRLTLSHSAYHLSVASFNSAGASPAASRPIPPMEDKGTVILSNCFHAFPEIMGREGWYGIFLVS